MRIPAGDAEAPCGLVVGEDGLVYNGCEGWVPMATAEKPIPSIIHDLFHNYVPETVDVERDTEWVILTVLTSGDWEQIKWAYNAYGKDRLEAVVRKDLEGLRTLPHPVANFWSVVFWGRQLPPFSAKEWWGTIRRMPSGRGNGDVNDLFG